MAIRIVCGMGLAAGFGATAALAVPYHAESHTWRFHADHVLGTSLDLAAVSERPQAAALAIDAARTEIARLDRVLSAWRSDSELMRLNGAREHRASTDLFAAIAACEEWRLKSGGAFSARLGRVLQACGDPALAIRADAADVLLDPVTRTISRPDAVEFAVDGLAKGYIIDRALEAATCIPGVEGMMVDIGGDLRCWGKAPNGPGWRVGVVDPGNPSDNAPVRTYLTTTNQAVATSGRSARNLLSVSPQTGRPVDHVAYATAVAATAADADALATAFSVLDPMESMRLADRLPNVAARIIGKDGEIHTSSRWMASCGDQVAQGAAAGWPAGFGLNIEYDVPRVSTGSYHNPYVAIWITDENRALVRTLLVLGTETRYREENYVYWRRFGRLDTKLVDSVSKPTRAPGHYTLRWDGLDDVGHKVSQGKYILNIEASREKGGHTVQRLELTLGADGLTAEAPAAEEVGKVRASYGRVL